MFLLLLLFGDCSFSLSWVSDKDRELGEAQAEIRALKMSERLREKAVEEVSFCFLLFLIPFVLAIVFCFPE